MNQTDYKSSRYVICYEDAGRKQVNNRAVQEAWELFKDKEIKQASTYLAPNVRILFGKNSGVCKFYRRRRKRSNNVHMY